MDVSRSATRPADTPGLLDLSLTWRGREDRSLADRRTSESVCNVLQFASSSVYLSTVAAASVCSPRGAMEWRYSQTSCRTERSIRVHSRPLVALCSVPMHVS